MSKNLFTWSNFKRFDRCVLCCAWVVVFFLDERMERMQKLGNHWMLCQFIIHHYSSWRSRRIGTFCGEQTANHSPSPRLRKSIFHFNDQSSIKIKHINCAMLFSQFIQASKQSSFDLPFRRFVLLRWCSCVHDQFQLYIRLINGPYPVRTQNKVASRKNEMNITTARNTSLETKFHFIQYPCIIHKCMGLSVWIMPLCMLNELHHADF